MPEELEYSKDVFKIFSYFTIKSRLRGSHKCQILPHGKINACVWHNPPMSGCQMQITAIVLHASLRAKQFKRTSETEGEESGGRAPCVRLFLDPGRGRHGQHVCRCGVPADKEAWTACLYCSPLGFLGLLKCLGIYQDKAICFINKMSCLNDNHRDASQRPQREKGFNHN